LAEDFEVFKVGAVAAGGRVIPSGNLLFANISLIALEQYSTII
jgi:hypothetical protein